MLNNRKLRAIRFYKASLAFTILVLLISLSCGKRKPPLPPLEKFQQTAMVSGEQRGGDIILKIMLPDQNASRKAVSNINRVNIYRLTESSKSPLTLSEEEFASRSTLISSLPINDEDSERKQIIFNDTLQFAEQNARLRYAVRFVNSAGQSASFSNFFLIELENKVADPPTSLTARVFENEITLQWNAPVENVDGSRPAAVLGYNIYRTINKISDSPEKININPVNDMAFSDRNFQFGTEYEYFVRALSIGNQGEIVESQNSDKISVNANDNFAPKPPSAITIAAAPGSISIFFAVNIEKDIAGYRIYRSTNPDQKLSEWELITKKQITTNTFQDKNIESGKTYFYYLTAIDTSGNASTNSEVVSETAP